RLLPLPARCPYTTLFRSDEINLTWRSELSADNTVVAGEWWTGVPAEPELSLEADIMRELGLALGDRVTYAIGGESLTAIVTSARDRKSTRLNSSHVKISY